MRLRRSLSGLVAAGGLVVLLAAPAAAHVTASPNSFDPGGYARFSLRVPHGCDGSPTTAVEVQIPSGIGSVKPEQMAGWEVSTVIGELDEPYESHGQTITEGVLEVRWEAEPGWELPDELFRDFGIQVQLPDTPGETLWFPTVQTCEEGESAWIQIPGDGETWGELDSPSPYLELTAADAAGEAAPDDAAADEAVAAPADDADEADDVVAVDLAAAEEGTDTLTWVALVVGVLGAALGGAGLVAARRRG